MITPIKIGQGDVVDGIVAKANERGVLLDSEVVWINVSRYAEPRPRLPKSGERVRLHLDGQGYIRQTDVLMAEELVDGADPSPPEEPSRQVEERSFPISNNPPADKDIQIRRMNALSSATAILSSGGRAADPEDVLALAARLEAWVVR